MSWIRFTSIVFATVVALLALINVVAAQHHAAHRGLVVGQIAQQEAC